MNAPATPTTSRYAGLMNRTVLVTGGASGIGASLVAHFAAHGCKVGFIDELLMPHHIAPMALFLASDDSALCTGQDFIVDGGRV